MLNQTNSYLWWRPLACCSYDIGRMNIGRPATTIFSKNPVAQIKSKLLNAVALSASNLRTEPTSQYLLTASVVIIYSLHFHKSNAQ
jgi:hypothetical protein